MEREKFAQTYASDAVAAKIAQARELLKSTTCAQCRPSSSTAGSSPRRALPAHPAGLEVLDRLVRLAREERLR